MTRPKVAPPLPTVFIFAGGVVTSLLWLTNPKSGPELKWAWGAIGAISLIALIWVVLKRRKLERARTPSNPPKVPQ
ncbi:MAG: hypothetical protein ABI903_00805 [Actinomycetota bacterium]